MTFRFTDVSETCTLSQEAGRSRVSVNKTGYCIPYTGILEMSQALLGGFIITGGVLIRVPPRRHPLFPWCRVSTVETNQPGELVTGLDPDPIEGPASLDRVHVLRPENDKAMVKITYELPDLDEDAINDNSNGKDDPDKEMQLASESWDFGAKVLRLPRWYYDFWSTQETGDTIDDFEITKIVPVIQIQLVRHYSLKIPIETIGKLIGSINKGSFLLAQARFPPETVRFEGLAATRKITSARGFKFYEITYKFGCFLAWAHVLGGPIGPPPAKPGDEAHPPDVLDPTWVGWNRVPNLKHTLKIFGKTVGAHNLIWDYLVPLRHPYDQDQVPNKVNPATLKVVRGFDHLLWQKSP